VETEVARLARELKAAQEQQSATSEVLQIISRSAFDLQTVLNRLVDSAARLCDVEIANIWRLAGGAYRMAASYGVTSRFKEYLENKEYLETIAIGPDHGSVVGRTLLTGKVVHVLDVQADPDYKLSSIVALGSYRTTLGVPLLREGVPIGVLFLGRTRVEPFTQQQIDLITTFADQAVIAVENTRLLNEDCYRRCPQDHQPVDVRFADSAANPLGISGSILRCRQGEHCSREGWSLLCRRGVRLLRRVSGVYEKYSNQSRARVGVRASTHRRPGGPHYRCSR
jgi:signal transduction protein with GAF and PtsI domain